MFQVSRRTDYAVRIMVDLPRIAVALGSALMNQADQMVTNEDFWECLPVCARSYRYHCRNMDTRNKRYPQQMSRAAAIQRLLERSFRLLLPPCTPR